MFNTHLPEQLPNPTQGGRYVREADGSLTLVDQIQDATQRDLRAHPATAGDAGAPTETTEE